MACAILKVCARSSGGSLLARVDEEVVEASELFSVSKLLSRLLSIAIGGGRPDNSAFD